ncbi:hypothetical protein AB0M57_13940 [Streptomyces sp. NPDC051597]|uniref:hypothetical protein n=1 Tax=Streptomyces sp. NPDC051597 TaxID=3155049 RepID=UPI00343E7B93
MTRRSPGCAAPDAPSSTAAASGCWEPTDVAALDEVALANAIAMVGYRPCIEQRVLADDDVRAVVVRPGFAYGQGGGISGLMVG